MTKIHLDTDIDGDMDDLCALAMLLNWPDLEITGVTTVSDERGRWAGYVQYVLSLMGRTDIPFAAAADVSGGYFRYELGYPLMNTGVISSAVSCCNSFVQLEFVR